MMARQRAILASCVLLTLLSTWVLSPVANAAHPRASVTLTMLWRTSPSEVPALRSVAAAFHSHYPNITVQPIIVTHDNYEPKLSALIAAGTPPDLFSSVGDSGFVDYALRGLGLNQQPFIQADHYDLSDFYPQAIQALQWKGQQLALPLGGGPSLMFYNVDLFKKAHLPPPPTNWDDRTWTWDKMVDYAKKLTLDDKGRNATDPIFDWKHTVQWGINPGLWPLDSYAWLWGCSWFPVATGLPSKNSIDTHCVTDSLQKVADLSVRYHVAPNPIQQQRFKMFQDPFVSGKIAMGMTGVWFLETNSTTIRRFHWAVAAVPLGKVRKDVLFTDPMMISKGSHHPKEAWQFVKFLLSPEGQGIFMKGYCCLSMRKSMLSSVLASKAPPGQPFSQVQQAVLGAFAHAQESSNHNIAQWAAIENLVNAELADVWNGKKTMAQEAPTLQAKLNSLLQQNIKRFGSGR